ncbi:hypothetical protein [Nocardiopsis coralliicola]
MSKTALPVKMLSIVSLIGLASFTTASSGIAPASAESDESGLPSIGQAGASNSGGFGESTVSVNDVTRSGQGNYATITWTISIHGDETYETKSDARGGTYRYNDRSVFRTLVKDSETGKTFHPLQDSDGFCLCTGNFYPKSSMDEVNDGETATYWSSYRISDDVSEVSLHVPGFEPVEDIPIG